MATTTKGKNVATPEAAAPAAEPDTIQVEFMDGDLPEDTHEVKRDGKYHRATELLKANPGKWGKLFAAKDRNGARTRTYQLRSKYPQAETGLQFEFRNNDVYGRYTPVKAK